MVVVTPSASNIYSPRPRVLLVDVLVRGLGVTYALAERFPLAGATMRLVGDYNGWSARNLTGRDLEQLLIRRRGQPKHYSPAWRPAKPYPESPDLQ